MSETEQEASKTVKKKHKTLTLTQKYEILQKLDDGVKIQELHKQYGVGRTTIFDIKKKRDKLEDFMKNVNFNSEKRTMRPSLHPDVENALYSWYIDERNKNVFINTEMLKEKAKFFAQSFGKDNFPASCGWIGKFKKRYGIKLSASKEDLSSVVDPLSFIKVLDEAESKVLEVLHQKPERPADEEPQEIHPLEISSVYSEVPQFLPYENDEMDRDEADFDGCTPIKDEPLSQEPKKEPLSEDEFDVFGKLVATQLRHLPLEEALLCEDKILALLRKERLHQLEKARSSK